MSATKRTASARSSTRLTSRVSAFNPQVTLFESTDLDDSPRRSKRVKTEIKTEESLLDLEDLEYASAESTSSRKPTKRKKAGTKSETKQDAISSSPVKHNVKSPKKAKVIPQVLSSPHPPPPNWQETYNAIREMRSRFVAPVDTMGCQMAQLEEKDPRVRLHVHPYLSVNIWINGTNIEQALLYAGSPHAFITNKRRSDACSCSETSESTWGQHIRGGHDSGRRCCYLEFH